MRQPPIVHTAEEATEGIADGASIMVAGFITGVPWNLLTALHARGTTGLTLIANNIGVAAPPPVKGAMELLEDGRVHRFIASFTASPHPSRHGRVEALARSGAIQVELSPQGTLAERIRAGGAGIPAFYVAAAAATDLAAGKETREIGGRTYLLEHALTADYAFIHAWKADTAGNLVFRMASRNFNPIMATAARHVIVEVEEPILPAGALRPDEIHTPGLYVERMLQIPPDGVFSLRRSVTALPGMPAGAIRTSGLDHDQMAAVVARYLESGWTVNLGVGIPSLTCNFLDPSANVLLTAENGLVGYGIAAPEGLQDRDTVNASGHYVLVEDGAAIVHHADAFGLIRSGRIDCAILGAYEVAQDGSFANWKPDATFPVQMGGIGGAMDLAAGAKQIFITMDHTTRDGRPRLVERCSLPVTAPGGVTLVVTDLAVIAIGRDGFELLEYAPGSSIEEVRALTGAPLNLSPTVRPMQI